MKKSILIVDDCEELTCFLSKVLKRAGYQVETATDGIKALQSLESQPAELVLADIFMPEMEGIELIRILRERTPDLPIIAMSGEDFGPLFMQMASMLGAVDTLPKPFTIEEVLHKIRERVPA